MPTKILLGLGESIGSTIWASRFIRDSGLQVRVVSHYRNHRYLDKIDWVINCLYSKPTEDFFGKLGFDFQKVNARYAQWMIDDMVVWEPNLVISDMEPLTAVVAKILDIPLWYCSPLLQYAIKDPVPGVYKPKIELTEGDRYLVYSPLVSLDPPLEDGFEWIRPYKSKPSPVNIITSEDPSEILNKLSINHTIATGETSFITDLVGSKFFISPNPEEPEQVMNARLFDYYNIARNIGRPEKLSYGLRQVEEGTFPAQELPVKGDLLHEKVRQYEREKSGVRYR